MKKLGMLLACLLILAYLLTNSSCPYESKEQEIRNAPLSGKLVIKYTRTSLSNIEINRLAERTLVPIPWYVESKDETEIFIEVTPLSPSLFQLPFCIGILFDPIFIVTSTKGYCIVYVQGRHWNNFTLNETIPNKVTSVVELQNLFKESGAINYFPMHDPIPVGDRTL